MSTWRCDQAQSVDVADGILLSLQGALKSMKEEIRLHLETQIQSGFDGLSSKLIEEIQNLPLHGSSAVYIENHTPMPSIIEEISALSTLEETDQVQPKLEDVSREETPKSIRQGSHTSIVSDRSKRMKPWRDAVVETIDKSFSNSRIESLMAQAKKRSLKDAEFPDNFLVRFVLGSFFTVFTFFMIVANSIWTAYENDYAVAQKADEIESWQSTVDSAFTIWFMVELVLRIAALRKYFFLGSDCGWNLLDLLLVLSSIPDLFVGGLDMNIMRMIRLVRVTRALRLIRLVKFFTSLREILLSVTLTLGSLCWSFVALALTSYTFALLITQWINFQSQDGVQYGKDVYDNFQTTQAAMVSLFSMISGGQEWYPVAEEFDKRKDYAAKYGLLLYIFFAVFGFVNVITGVFVAKAAEATETDEHLRVAKQQEARDAQIRDLIKTFYLIDTHGTGCIDAKEFHDFFAHAKGHYMLQSLGLQLFDLDEMWHVLDLYDGKSDGFVDLPGFVMGVMRLSGDAKSTELVLMSFKVEEMLSALRKNQSKIDELVRRLQPVQHLPNGEKYKLGTTSV